MANSTATWISKELSRLHNLSATEDLAQYCCFIIINDIHVYMEMSNDKIEYDKSIFLLLFTTEFCFLCVGNVIGFYDRNSKF